MEYYLYEVYFEPDADVKTLDIPIGEYYRTFGELCQNMGKYKAAKDAYMKALSWNPVDLDSYLGLAESYKYQNMMNRYLEVTRQAYRYCCTRATMARYYRNMAFYYLSNYKPEIARDAYQYANVYYHTDNADSELKYIESAINEKTPDIDIRRIQKVFTEEGIEPGPDSKTIGIIYRVGELMMEDREYKLARDCFSICYDITREAGLEKILDELEKALKDNGNE
jgi:tetratricopeptide (TPR) repeat protein